MIETEREVIVTSATPVQREGLTLVRLVYYILDLVVAVLLVRLGLRLFGANPGNEFVSFIYSFTQPLVTPFQGIFPPAEAAATLEWASIVAILAYTLIAYAIARLVEILTRV